MSDKILRLAFEAVHVNRSTLGVFCTASVDAAPDRHSARCKACADVVQDAMQSYARIVARSVRNAADKARVQAFGSVVGRRGDRFELSHSTLSHVAVMIEDGALL